MIWKITAWIWRLAMALWRCNIRIVSWFGMMLMKFVRAIVRMFGKTVTYGMRRY